MKTLTVLLLAIGSCRHPHQTHPTPPRVPTNSMYVDPVHDNAPDAPCNEWSIEPAAEVDGHGHPCAYPLP